MSTVDREKLRQYLWDHVVLHLVQLPTIEGGMWISLAVGIRDGSITTTTTSSEVAVNLGHQLVIRRMPRVWKGNQNANNIMREFRILQALKGSEVPVPNVFHACESGAILGAPWFCMEFLEGVVYNRPSLKEMPSYMRRGAYKSAVAALARIHKVDWRRRGLNVTSANSQDIPYFERQLRTLLRTVKQQTVHAGDLKGIRELAEGLERALKSIHLPPGSTLIHGDFQINNIIFKLSPLNEISGIIDWELSTIGHPMADVATLVAPLYTQRSKLLFPDLADVDLTSMDLPSAQEVLNMYHDASGCDESYLKEENFNLFMAFTYFKYAVITHGVTARKQIGVASSSSASAVAAFTNELVHLAFVELQKLQTRINNGEERAAAAAVPPSSSLPLLNPHYRAVIMDVGGVLCASPLEAITKHELKYGFPPTVIAKAMGNSSITSQLWRGELDLNREVLNKWSEEMKEKTLLMLQSNVESFPPPHAICLHLDELIRDIVMCIQRSIPEMLSCLSELISLGIKVAILSNDFRVEHQLAKELGLDVLDREKNIYKQLKLLGITEQSVLRSSRIGLCKPHPDVYLAACKAIGVLPTESIMCDDLRENLAPAASLGMGTVWFGLKQAKRIAIAELMSLLKTGRPSMRQTYHRSSNL